MNRNRFYSPIKSGVVSLLISASLFSQAVVLAPVQAEQLGSQDSSAAFSPSIGGCSIFPSNNIWNAPVNNLPVHTRSDQWVSTIGRDTGFHMDFGSGLWDGGLIGIPYNIVGSSIPKVPVSFYYPGESDPGPYPIPNNPLIEHGSDHHILIIDNSTCMLYELYDASYSDGTWHAGSGAIWNLNSNALRPDTWTSADAAGLPILPGLVRYDEIVSGEINHAIRFTAENTNGYVWPARHLTSNNPNAPQIPPMGARFRLKASYNISGYPPAMQVILRAMKTYGIILADNGSNWYVSGAPDERWNNDMLHLLDDLTGNDFEAVDTSRLMVDYDSGATGSMPGATTLTTPTGNIGTNYTPAYSWKAVSGATWYYLYVNGPSGNVIKTWYQASAVCSGDMCSVTPSVTLTGSNYTWWVRTYNSVGYGPWSAGLTFTVTPPSLPGAASLNSPAGSVIDTTPTYSWNAVSGATWYFLWVNNPSGTAVIKQWFSASTACSGGTCSATPAKVLGNGTHRWFVQTWNSAGYGPWSSGLNFTVSPPPKPGATTLIAPNSSTTDTTPTYSWNAVSGADWYFLWVNNPSGTTVIKQWFQASTACSGGTCSATPATGLGLGTHRWWVQTYNTAGYGPWSSGLNFTTTP
jgi:hypothetical protein